MLCYFAVSSLVGVLLVLAMLLYFYRSFANDALEQHETHGNTVISQIFVSTLWPKYADAVRNAHLLTPAQLQQRSAVAQFRADVLQQVKGLSVVRIKVYDLRGMTVFSNDIRQVGEDRMEDDGVRSAIAGRTSSQITAENLLDGFEKTAHARKLISTCIPIRTEGQEAPEGVFQVYSDVTDYMAEMNRTSWMIVGVVLGSLSFLYVFLFAFVRRADRTLREQNHEEMRSHKAMLAHQALHDPLTGLPNRSSLAQQLRALLNSLSDTQGHCALLCLGVDGFKEVNDSLGHLVGDAALMEIGTRLVHLTPPGGITARMGGDEFAVVLRELGSTLEVEHIVQAIERLQKRISNMPILVNGQDLSLTVSVGVAIYPDDGRNVDELLQAADLALTHAKKQGRNRYQFHATGMNERALEMLLVERDLRRALDENQFVLYYQPKVDLHSGHITGAEALIRWQHPTRGLVGPANFIALAEERGLIVQLGEWVMQQACRQNITWQRAGMAPMPIAINLSAHHFKKPSLLRDVQQILYENDLPAYCLELELTEISIMQDAEATISTMKRLKEVGVYLALDDFGTGYSSLSQLKGLPLDNIKLDQSFVRGLGHDGDDLAICTAVIAMGKALGLKVIAEGVENHKQLDMLRQLGCDVGQGFLFARPLTAPQLLDFVRHHGDEQVRIFDKLGSI
ncbi:MAG: EAL domain-containing protein [Rhodoferax sp.]|nr:EAL domain-containing protein [Rhodoferax sp.]